MKTKRKQKEKHATSSKGSAHAFTTKSKPLCTIETAQAFTMKLKPPCLLETAQN